MDVEDAVAPRLADEREVERREVVGEDRDDVEAHRGHTPRSSSPGGASTTTRPASRSTVGTIAATNGTWAWRPSGSRTTSRSWAAPSSSPPTCAEHGARRVDDGEAAQLLLGEDVVVVLGGQRVVAVDDEAGAAQRLGAGAVGDLLERHEPDPVVHPGGPHGEHPRDPGAGRGLRVEGGAHREPAVGLVGVQLHGHLTVQAVGLADAGDDGALGHGGHPVVGVGLHQEVRRGTAAAGCAGSLLPAHPAVVVVRSASRVSGPGRCRRCRCAPGDRRRAHP